MKHTFKGQITLLWNYRELLKELFIVFVKLRHAGSVLGILWTLLNPLLFIFTYWFVFSFVFRMGLENYPLFLIPGYLAWNYSFNAITSLSATIINHRYLITKIAFPNEIIVIAGTSVFLLDFIIAGLLYLFIVLLFGFNFSIHILWLPLLLFLQVILTLGLSFIFSTVSVYFKDVPKLLIVIGTILFFLTPIFYPISYIPEGYRNIILLNPFALIINLYHDILYYNQQPDIIYLSISFVVSILIFLIGLRLFNKYKYSFAELS